MPASSVDPGLFCHPRGAGRRSGRDEGTEIRDVVYRESSSVRHGQLETATRVDFFTRALCLGWHRTAIKRSTSLFTSISRLAVTTALPVGHPLPFAGEGSADTRRVRGRASPASKPGAARPLTLSRRAATSLSRNGRGCACRSAVRFKGRLRFRRALAESEQHGVDHWTGALLAHFVRILEPFPVCVTVHDTRTN
jgi:hypothetical protein